MRYVIFAVVIMILAASAAGAEDVIKIIQEDGTVAVFDLGTKSAAPPEKSPPPVPPAEKAVQKESPAPKPVLKEVSVEAPEKPAAKKSLAKKTVVKKPAVKNAVKEAAVKKPKPPAEPVQQAKRVIPPGTEITEDLARSIAFDRAPPEPARAVQVVQRTYKDKLVFVVTFRTESGARDVLVDARNGDVVAVN